MDSDPRHLHGCGEQTAPSARLSDDHVAKHNNPALIARLPSDGRISSEGFEESLEPRRRPVRPDAAATRDAHMPPGPEPRRQTGTSLFDLRPTTTEFSIPSVVGETAHMGYFDDSLPPLLTVDSFDTLHYPDTLSGFGGKVDRATTVDDLVGWREANSPWGPHTVIGPVAVADAQLGDAVEVRILQMDPIDYAVNYCLPAPFGLGTLPNEHPDGATRVMDIDQKNAAIRFAAGISIPLRPFPGILGVTPAVPGRRNSVPPGPFGGNLDLRELTVGSRIFLPVQRTGAGIWIGDFHAAQGDGEVNLTAAETAMRDARIQLVLHKRAFMSMPFAETPTHWIAIGLGGSFEEAFRMSLHGLLGFAVNNIGIEKFSAYALLSLAASFRITQVVNASYGIHGMLPKNLFVPEIIESTCSVPSRRVKESS